MNSRFHRRSIRLIGFEYTQPGGYFVTLVAWRRECLFGQVVKGEMQLNPYAKIPREEWLKTAEIRSNVELHADEFVVMPNHFHGIIWLVGPAEGASTVGETSIGKTTVRATCQVAPPVKSTTLIPNSLGAIIGHFKAISSKRINSLRKTHGLHVWQRNYYEHILRSPRDLENTWNYIDANPANWENDEEKR